MIHILERPQLLKVLPHTEHALCIDRVIFDDANPRVIQGFREFEPEDFEFQGHFPGNPICPGHWLEEMCCLTAGCLVKLGMPPDKPNATMIVTFKDNIRIRTPVVPGDTICIRVELTRIRLGSYAFTAKIINQNQKLVIEIGKITGRPL